MENPKLKVQIQDNTLIARVNGKKLTGNTKVIFASVDASRVQIVDSSIDNEILIEKAPLQVMDDMFGLSIETDYKIVYDRDEVWKQAKMLATKQVKKEVKSKFKLDTNLGTI